MRFMVLLLSLVWLAGCATGVTAPQPAPDGSFVISVTGSRVRPTVIEPIEEALAEARYKCWSERKGLAVLQHQTETSGFGRTATLRFACAGAQGAVAMTAVSQKTR